MLSTFKGVKPSTNRTQPRIIVTIVEPGVLIYLNWCLRIQRVTTVQQSKFVCTKHLTELALVVPVFARDVIHNVVRWPYLRSRNYKTRFNKVKPIGCAKQSAVTSGHCFKVMRFSICTTHYGPIDARVPIMLYCKVNEYC